MDIVGHIRLLSQYNRWMNDKCYAAAETLPADAITTDRGALFKSIFGTLNHLYVVDVVWLQRFATHPAGYLPLKPLAQQAPITALDQQVETELSTLRARRQQLDEVIRAWAATIEPRDLDYPLPFHDMRGTATCRNFGSLVLNLFNHQTHHRGQLTTLLLQAGVDVGATDLYELIPEAPLPNSDR